LGKSTIVLKVFGRTKKRTIECVFDPTSFVSNIITTRYMQSPDQLECVEVFGRRKALFTDLNMQICAIMEEVMGIDDNDHPELERPE
jgi:hypothetical protein